VVLGDGTEVRRGNTYEQGEEWERRGEVRKWMDVPLHLLSTHNRYVCLQVDTTIECAVCKIGSVKVIQTISHSPIPNRRSCLQAWERRLPCTYVIASSPGSLSLAIDVEIESMNTAVRRCTQALINCGVMGCSINIEWAQLNNVPTRHLTNLIPVYNINGTANETGMIVDSQDHRHDPML
jgi:hypothetical protein